MTLLLLLIISGVAASALDANASVDAAAAAQSASSRLLLPRCLRSRMLMTTAYPDGAVERLLVMHVDVAEHRTREDYFGGGGGGEDELRDDAARLPRRHHTTISDYVRQEQALLMRRDRAARAFAPASCVIAPLSGAWPLLDDGAVAAEAGELSFSACRTLPRAALALERGGGAGGGSGSGDDAGASSAAAPDEGAEQRRGSPAAALLYVSTWRWRARSSLRSLLQHLGEGLEERASKAPHDIFLSLGVSACGGSGAAGGAELALAAGARRPTLDEIADRLILIEAPSRRTNYTVLDLETEPACSAEEWLYDPEDDLFALGEANDPSASESADGDVHRVQCAPAALHWRGAG